MGGQAYQVGAVLSLVNDLQNVSGVLGYATSKEAAFFVVGSVLKVRRKLRPRGIFVVNLDLSDL